MENIVVVVQARCSSSRFPNKILEKIKNKTLIEFLFSRLFKSKKIDNFYLATTKKKSDNKLCKIFKDSKVKIYRGDENNVLDRYYKIAKESKAKIIIRITGDCPLVDYRIIDKFIHKMLTNKYFFL